MPASVQTYTANPVLVEVRRGDHVESVHRGAFCVVDSSGNVRAASGNIDRRIFPRSSVKMLQALPLIESGAADHSGLTNAQIALACASHNGEDGHVRAVQDWLSNVGATPALLECGCHQPLYENAALALAAQGRTPTAVHNNCSGKHAGFITTSRHLRIPVCGYVDAAHPIQQAVAAAVSDMTECDLVGAARGTDGCGIPTYAIPLVALAHGVAKLAAPDWLPPSRAKAVRRIFEAVVEHPWLVGGTERFDTAALQASRGAFVVKMGAEGVHVAAHRKLGLGIALKIDDGARRAADVAMAALLQKFRFLEASLEVPSERLSNSRGETIGVICAVFERYS
jgi:L-asparaginase II